MDLAVRRGLTAGLVVDLAVPVGGRPRPTRRAPGLRNVRLEWQGARDPALWNWVRSVEPADASAEEVAAALWVPVHRNWDGSGSIYAHRLIAKPPLFGVPPAMATMFAEARRHAPDTSHITSAATRIGELMKDRGGGWDREVIRVFEQVPPAARVELQRRLDMPALLAAMGDFEASRLGTLGPVTTGRELLNRKRAAYIKQAIDDYAPERAQVFILFVFRGVYDDDAYSIFAELANRRRISELLAMPELARVFKARGLKTDGFQEPAESWTNVFPALGNGLRNAVKDPRAARYREQAHQLPPEYYRALWDLEKADVERGLAPKNVVRSLVDHVTFGVPLGIVDLARGTARGIGDLVDGEYEHAGHNLAGAALVVLAHLGVKAWHVARGAIAATSRTNPRSGGQTGQGQADPGHAGSSTTVREPDGPGQFTLPNFQGPITAAEARLGAIFALNPEAQAAMGRLISRIGTGGVERVAGFVQREHRAALFVAEHGEAAVYALLEAGGDVTAARTRLPSRQLAPAESAASPPTPLDQVSTDVLAPHPTAPTPAKGANFSVASLQPLRVTTPVTGLYTSIDPAAAPPTGWIVDDARNADSIRTTVTAPNGATGHIWRSYDAATREWVMKEAFFDSNMPRWIDLGKQMVPGKGTPLIAYLDMRQMRLLNISYGSLKIVKLSTIQNVETICQFEANIRKGMKPAEAIRITHSVEYAETGIVQSGHRLTGVRVTQGHRGPLRVLLEHYEASGFRTAVEHDKILVKYGIGRDANVLWNFDIEIDVTPF
ncbi:MAG TPA: hypothetical protein VN253_17430 [Kofleriaceae bacterium]|nr:hypothetical protein [Kofleriaceae bacterium]